MSQRREFETRLLADCVRKRRYSEERASSRARSLGIAHYYCAFCAGYHLAAQYNEELQRIKSQMMVPKAQRPPARPPKPSTYEEVIELQSKGKTIEILNDDELLEVINHTLRRRRAVNIDAARTLTSRQWLHAHNKRFWLSDFASQIMNYWMNGFTVNQIRALIAAREGQGSSSLQGTKRLVRLQMIANDCTTITPHGIDVLLAIHPRILRLIAGDPEPIWSDI